MKTNKLVEASIIFLGFGLLFLALKEFHTFLRPFVIALILSFLFVPLTRLSAKKKKLVWVSTFGVAAAIFFITTLLTSIIVSDSATIDKEIETTQVENSYFLFEDTSSINVAGHEILVGEYFNAEKLTNMISTIAAKLFSSLGTFFSELFLVILFLVFLLPSHDITIKRICDKLDRVSKKKFRIALEQIEGNIRSYLLIKSTISLITAFLSGIIMIFFGVESVFLFSFLIFILNFIPSIGSIIAVGIILLSHFLLVGFSGGFIFLAILLILVQIIMGNYIEPEFAGRQLELSPIIIILSLFFWGSVWGIGGMFFAVPLTSIIKIVLQNVNSTTKYVAFLS